MIKEWTVPFPSTAPVHGAIVTYHLFGVSRICGESQACWRETPVERSAFY
jgi:hypothetical protein